MIRQKQLPVQPEFWVHRDSIVTVKGSTFYDQLAEDLDREGFGDAVRNLCAPYYSEKTVGRPPMDPEVYFKMLMVGFFDRIGSERGIAARCEDSLSIRRFLRYDITEATPNHSTLSVIRERLPEEVYAEVFALSLKPLRRAEIITGEKIGIDSSLFEANASLEKLVRCADGKSYRDYLKELAKAAGIDPEDTAAVMKFDRNRKDKKISNQEWYSPNDPDAKIGPRKDGAWDMTHKVENVVDLDSGALLSIEVQAADKADCTDMASHLATALEMVEYADQQLAEEKSASQDGESNGELPTNANPEKGQKTVIGVGDKGYHKNEELARLVESGITPCIAEPAGRQPSKSSKAQAEAFHTNRATRHSEPGRELLKRRSEKVERSFRHILDHGGARRTTLCGRSNIAKRMYISGFAFNRSIYAWNVHRYGTVKQFRAGNRNVIVVVFGLIVVFWARQRIHSAGKSLQTGMAEFFAKIALLGGRAFRPRVLTPLPEFGE